MDKNLKNALIIIAVLVGVYYFISPLKNCERTVPNPSACGYHYSW